ncbi:DUF2807 domain-containing protein [Flavobacteriaceae bacterium F08102]|nr:DUF2807 domain-containing protein [Flavobacteriaceae bacterium F08102]
MKIYHIKIVFLLMTLIPLGISAQEKLKGNKIVVSETRDVDDFTKIDVNNKIDVVITQGTEQIVTVEGDENLLPAVLTEVRNGVLVISVTKKILRKKVLKVHITIDQFIEEITTNERAYVSSFGGLKFDKITINAEGDSKVTLDMNCSEFFLNNNASAVVNLTVHTTSSYINANKTGKAKINLTTNTAEILTQGNSTTEISGIANELLLNAENKSNFKGEHFEVNTLKVYGSDGADIHVNAASDITISAINTSEIYIYNNPTITIENFTDKAVLRKR